MNDITIIYYSANTENPIFERKVIENIKKYKGDLPVVSVTQIPMDFGKNICVGRQVNCYANEFRQIAIGLREIRTPYVLTCEADCLYPPEYFQFVPPKRGRSYHYANSYLLYCLDDEPYNYFRFKGMGDYAQAVDREWWLKRIDLSLKNPKYINSDWGDNIGRNHLPQQPKNHARYSWTSDNPIVTVKTGAGVRKHSPSVKGHRLMRKVPFWGSKGDVINSFMK